MPTTDHGGWKYGHRYGVQLPNTTRIDGTLVAIEQASELGGAIGLWLRRYEEPSASAFFVAVGPGMIVRRMEPDTTYREVWQEQDDPNSPPF
jgi:hypothetical protein